MRVEIDITHNGETKRVKINSTYKFIEGFIYDMRQRYGFSNVVKVSKEGQPIQSIGAI